MKYTLWFTCAAVFHSGLRALLIALLLLLKVILIFFFVADLRRLVSWGNVERQRVVPGIRLLQHRGEGGMNACY